MDWSFYPAAGILPADSAGRPRPEKYVGRTTRMGVEQYQDYTLYINDDRADLAGRNLSDAQLCARVSRRRYVCPFSRQGRSARFHRRQDTRRLWRLISWSTGSGRGSDRRHLEQGTLIAAQKPGPSYCH
jgi:hypothetical protein